MYTYWYNSIKCQNYSEFSIRKQYNTEDNNIIFLTEDLEIKRR